jgi:Zn-dependent protease with chaperone function
MDLSGLFASYPGMYIVQSFLHLTVSAVIVSTAIRVWNMSNPRITQRCRFLAIIFPIFSFPLYQFINPARGSIFFRESSLIDSSRWLNLAIFEKIPLGVLFIFMLLLTTAVFVLQELIPVVRHSLESGGEETREVAFVDSTGVNEVLTDLPGEKPEVRVMEEEDCVVFSTTGRKATVYLSSGLLKVLEPQEIQAAVAHEIAHIERSKLPVLFIVFLLRVLLFFNPVVLFEFRRATQEEEEICDDMAVALTHKPHALAETLKKLYRKGEHGVPEIGKLSDLRASLEEYSHVTHIESRIARLEKDTNTDKTDSEWLGFSMIFAVIIVINYYIV